MLQKEIKLKGGCQSPVGCPSLLVFFVFFLSSFCLSCILKTWAATLESAIFMSGLQQKSVVWTWRRRPTIESTVINPNVFLLSMDLLAWLVQTNYYLAWTSNSLLAFPSRHSGSLENNQDIRQFGWDKYVRENILGVRLEPVWIDLERATD